jgi:ZIP family zinc transporter
MSIILNAVGLSLLAGMGTGLGGFIAILRRPGRRTFGFLMGITAGVMITLSFLELVNEAWQHGGFIAATIGFGSGAVFMLLIDMLIPHIRFGEREFDGFGGQKDPDQRIEEDPRHHHWHRRHRQRREMPNIDVDLFKTGMLVAIGIAIHNTPEGIAVGAGYMHTPQFGLFIAIAIALHNIPEGIATALPLYRSGADAWFSFRAAFLSGLAEPLGALLAVLFLTKFQSFIPGSLAFAGGVMVFITLDELVPAAREHGHQHYTAMGIILGALFVFVLSGLFGV